MLFKKACCFIAVLNLCGLWSVAQTEPVKAVRADLSGVTLYDADSGHLWNRLYAALFLRVDTGGNAYGPDSLDILLWTETKHLLTEPSHGAALKVLDEFIASHGEKLIESPLKRAVMQRDLWAAYEWTVRMGNIDSLDSKTHPLAVTLNELKSRLAVVIKRIALSREQIEALPDNYATAVASAEFASEPDPAHSGAPFLPPALFQPESPWGCLGSGSDSPLASVHAGSCTYRSTFLVFIRLPGGRAALQAYLDIIKKSTPYIGDPTRPKPKRGVILINGQEAVKRNPEMPQIPPGTMVALVRQMVLIDKEGRPATTHLTESVQFRIYRRIVEDDSELNEEHAQFFSKFLMDRKQLFSNISGGLRPAGNDDKGFGFGPETQFTGHDPFDSSEPIQIPPQLTMQNCIMCHRTPGVFSINSISDLFDDRKTRLRLLHITTPQLEKEKDVKQREKWPQIP